MFAKQFATFFGRSMQHVLQIYERNTFSILVSATRLVVCGADVVLVLCPGFASPPTCVYFLICTA